MHFSDWRFRLSTFYMFIGGNGIQNIYWPYVMEPGQSEWVPWTTLHISHSFSSCANFLFIDFAIFILSCLYILKLNTLHIPKQYCSMELSVMMKTFFYICIGRYNNHQLHMTTECVKCSQCDRETGHFTYW